MKLVPGQNVQLTDAAPMITVAIPAKGYVLHAFALSGDGTASCPSEAVFYGRSKIPGLSMRVQDNNLVQLLANPAGIPETTDRFLICLSAWSGFVAAACEEAIRIRDGGQEYTADIPFTGNYERSLILGELYRRNGGLRFRIKMDGFKHGIEAVNEAYGLRLETAAPVQLDAPAATGAGQ